MDVTRSDFIGRAAPGKDPRPPPRLLGPNYNDNAEPDIIYPPGGPSINLSGHLAFISDTIAKHRWAECFFFLFLIQAEGGQISNGSLGLWP